MSTFERTRTRFMRDTREGWAGGVCAGLGRALNIDTRFVRAGVVIAAVFFTKIVLAAYLVAWILMPAGDDSIS